MRNPRLPESSPAPEGSTHQRHDRGFCVVESPSESGQGCWKTAFAFGGRRPDSWRTWAAAVWETIKERTASRSPEKSAVIQTSHGSLLDSGQLMVGILCPPGRDLHCTKRPHQVGGRLVLEHMACALCSEESSHMLWSTARCRGLCVDTT